MSTPSSLVARHLRNLQAAGWTQPEIAAAAHVDRRTVYNVLTGKVATVHQRTAHAILALRPRCAPRRVSVVGPVRRIQALAVMGWPTTHTGALAGLQLSQVNDLMSGRVKTVPRAHADAIDEVFRTLCHTAGPSPRTRTIAARNAWVPASAWHDIDNPQETATFGAAV
jgi:hypothetical protein